MVGICGVFSRVFKLVRINCFVLRHMSGDIFAGDFIVGYAFLPNEVGTRTNPENFL